ncbi:Oligomeric Golgi complex subunit 1 [Fusarium odoratissimum]|uniref:Conserved oligomeric Golgi complex subunit 1 n=1 Tax=Fusarium oxysporum f. sp. cubense (strain race 4) TaxID=2502994 RepID=N1RXP0_FUSC4|nr:Oligomeric Golgi complex subunit 1 [Fusarium odoratissimum]
MADVDTSKLTSSAQIFSPNNTLPQIRAIHKSLHVAIEEKSTRLRTQVGSSYRDLLGTADTIVHMRDDNDVVQELLGKMGGRCGRAVISAKATGLANFVAKENKYATSIAARLRLLDACVLVVGRILKGSGGLGDNVKKGDRLVLSTKVLVLSRLLIKSLSDDATDTSSRQAIETARASVSKLRRRLLRNVEKVFERAGDETEREDVQKALCAYSLATSSGARDVLRHFLHVRAEAMGLAFEAEENNRKRSADDVVQSLRLYSRTLLDVQALVPGRLLSLALSGLKSHRLLADPGLKQLEGLRLDIYERWCDEEIQYFTPFVRHDDLDGSQAREMLAAWSEKGSEVLLDGLKKTLNTMSEFKSIMELRTNVLELWIRDGGKARGIDPSEMQDSLREAINSRMLEVLDTKVSKLRLVGSEVSASLGRWKDGITDEHVSIWNEEGYDEALAGGAAPFVQEVVSRFYGRNDAVSKAAHSYKSWYHVIDDVKEVVEQLRRQRWDNDYDEIEDEETIEARQKLLSKDDPQMLQERLDATLDKSFKELEDQIQSLWDERAESSRNGKVAMYFLRVLRDIRHQLPERPSIKSFGLKAVPSMHEKVAVAVSQPTLEEFSTQGLSQRVVVGRPLWDGEPALPNQPSPEIFQFLRSLSLSMSDEGADLWTKAAVSVLKKHLTEQLCKMWEAAVVENSVDNKEDVKDKKSNEVDAKEKDDDDTEDENAEETDEKKASAEEELPKPEDASEEQKPGLSAEQKTDVFTQWLFDIALLRRCIGNTESAGSSFQNLEDNVYRHSKLDEAAKDRILKSANDFWQRASLLFGLLA